MLSLCIGKLWHELITVRWNLGVFTQKAYIPGTVIGNGFKKNDYYNGFQLL